MVRVSLFDRGVDEGGGTVQSFACWDRAGTMIAAARRCSVTSATFVATPSGIVTDGRQDSAVSATATWTKRRRGEALPRLSPATRKPPTTAPTNVSWAKPRSGILSPSIANDTPAAWSSPAAAVTTAAAIAPTAMVVRFRATDRRVLRVLWEGAVRLAVLADIVGSLRGGGAVCAAH